jgi:leader peptidase (prepilin peptidase)/N-methyltransferase
MDAIIEVNAGFPWFFRAFVFVFGACIGSFLNVCIYRIPAGRSIVTPGSTCACGQPIAWFDNIPIFSWLILGGRARCCGGRFSVRYPAVELATGLLFLGCWWNHPPAVALVQMILVSLLLCGALIDLDHMIIPDRFSIGAAVVGVIASGLVPALHGFSGNGWMVDGVRSTIESMTGVFVSSGLVLWIALLAETLLRREAMGFGDVKLLGGIGAFLGWQGGMFSLFAGAVIGTLAFAFLLLLHGLGFRRRPREGGGGGAAGYSDGHARPSDAQPFTGEDDPDPSSEDDAPIRFGQHTPFGPMLSAGAIVYVLGAGPYVDAHLRDVADLIFSAL